ncbi:MAG: hypothetical protein HZC13_06440 [Nitrospirae bacterium]|nr:hypothetical protein [Nitrospirota bacterium]MBI5096254.1 hypothetical protein [Nitrospirota bacterium]
MNPERLLQNFDRLIDTPDAVPRLRRFIFDLAVRGKLVEQDPADESAAELLKRIGAEKKRIIQTGESGHARTFLTINVINERFNLPGAWTWVSIEDIAYVEMGQSPSSEFYNQHQEGMPFYQGKADFGKIHPTPRYWCTSPTKLAQKGDILISVRAS